MSASSTSTADKLIRAADSAQQRERKYMARKRVNRIALALSLVAMVFGVFWLVWILWSTVQLGVGGLNWTALSQSTPAPNDTGASTSRSTTPRAGWAA
jgi:phosphate transport system permease protein